MGLRLLFLDAETYYDKEYSLRRMTTPAYILDPRFELQMVAAMEPGQDAKIIDGPDFPAFLASHPPQNTATVTFNALFDNSILAWRYNYVPARMICGMAMARALIGHQLKNGASLEAVAETMGIGKKGNALVKVMGMRRAEIIKNPHLWLEFCAYAIQDVKLLAKIFTGLYAAMPKGEFELLDMTLRCAVQPRFVVDKPLLREHIAHVKAEKLQLLKDCGAEKPELMSTGKFANLLENLGVRVQHKPSKSNPDKTIPALAKTDAFMASLVEHPDERVAALASARLGHKSTIEETRAEKILSIAELPWPSYCGGNLPIPLGYGKTHTHRLAGEWGMNMQNLPSSRAIDKKTGLPKSKLRKALLAPPGHKVVVADLKQIEARLVAWICGCKALTDQFANNLDPYAIMGSKIFGYEVDPKVHKLERFIGKTGILGLGYGCGVDKFFDMVKLLARTLDIDLGTLWDYALAQQSVKAYRDAYSQIPTAWYWLDKQVRTVWLNKVYEPVQFGPVEIGHGYVRLPNWMYLRYNIPHADNNQECWYYHGRYRHKMYGAKLLENIVQALARVVVMNAALRIKGHGDPCWSTYVQQAHDELAYIVPDAMVDTAKQIVYTEMTRLPSWGRGIPLDADVSVGQSYGEAK
jgi:DNA polymerase